MNGIYIGLFSKALCNVFTFIHSHTHSYTNGGGNHARHGYLLHLFLPLTMANYGHGLQDGKMTLTMTFQGQDNPICSKQYQKWITHVRISWYRPIAPVFTPNNGQVMATVFRMAKWPWPWPFKVRITRNVQNNIRNEFPMPQLVRIEVLHVYIQKGGFSS